MLTKYAPDGDGVGQGGAPATTPTPTPPAATGEATPAPRTYTQEEVTSYGRDLIGRRDQYILGTYLRSPEAKDVIMDAAKALGLTIAEAKQAVQRSAEADPDDPLAELKQQIAELKAERDGEKNVQKETVAQQNFDTTVKRLAQAQPYGKDPVTAEYFENVLRGFFYSPDAKKMSPQEAAANIQANMEAMFKARDDAAKKSADAARRQPLAGSSSAGGITKVPENLTKDEDVERTMGEILRMTGGLHIA